MSYRPIRPLFAAALALSAAAAVPTLAAQDPPAPRFGIGGQAPGYYRMHIGRYEVTALLDGTHPFPVTKLAVGARPGHVAALLADQSLTSPYEGMINAFLVDMGDRLVLIDTGAGDLYGAEGGGLVAALRASGHTPDQIDDIVITHLHEDHAGGLLRDGRMVFPKAVVHVPRADLDFWLNDANQATVAPLLRPFFPAIRKVLAPYRAAGRVRPIAPGAALFAGLTALPAPGHTPGHTLYLLQDGGQSMLFWGDTVHMQPVQLPEPRIAIRYDWNVPAAIRSRMAIFARAAREHWWVAGAHVSFPGIGHVRALGAGRYRWVPANYTRNR